MTPAMTILAIASAIGIAAYLVSAYRHDRRVDAEVIAEAERIIEQASR